MAIVPAEFRTSYATNHGAHSPPLTVNMDALAPSVNNRIERPVGFADGRGHVRCVPCNERIAGILPYEIRAEDINASDERCIHCGQPLRCDGPEKKETTAKTHAHKHNPPVRQAATRLRKTIRER